MREFFCDSVMWEDVYCGEHARWKCCQLSKHEVSFSLKSPEKLISERNVCTFSQQTSHLCFSLWVNSRFSPKRKIFTDDWTRKLIHFKIFNLFFSVLTKFSFLQSLHLFGRVREFFLAEMEILCQMLSEDLQK